MHLLQLRDQIPKAIMLKLAQEGMRNIGRYVATAGAFADLGGKSPGNGGGQLLSAERLTHTIIIPMVRSLPQSQAGRPANPSAASGLARARTQCYPKTSPVFPGLRQYIET